MQKRKTSKLFSALSIFVCAVLLLAIASPGQASPARDGGSSDPADNRPASYALKKGEFPYCIARRYNVDPRQLLRINGLNAGMIFYPNQVLYMPSGMDPFPVDRALHAHAPYTVKRGDTLGKVACYFGDVDPAAIADLNGLSEPYKLAVGTVLTIPGGATATSSASKAEKASTPAKVEKVQPTPTKKPAPTLTPTPGQSAEQGGGKAEVQPTATSSAPQPTATSPAAQKAVTPTVTINPDVFGPQKTPTPAFNDANKPNLFQAIIRAIQGFFTALFQKRFGAPQK